MKEFLFALSSRALCRLLPVGAALLCLTAPTSATEPLAWARLSNPSDFARADETVTFSLSHLQAGGDFATGDLVARRGGEPIPLQVWDRDGDGEDDAVSVLVDLAPAATIELTLHAEAEPGPEFPSRVQAEISHKVGGRWNGRVYEGGTFQNVDTITPPPAHTDHSFYIRYEGPGIESDKVGYRFYLDWRNGFDIFGKTTSDLVLQDVGQDGFDSYHEMAPWGMDILKVGDSVGSGGFGYWNGDAIERVSTVDGWTSTVTANGPIIAGIQTLYRDWKADGKTMDLTARLRMEAGSRIVWVDLDSTAEISPLAAGLVKHPAAELMQGPTEVPMVTWMYLATYGPQTLHGDDQLGMALVFRKSTFRRFVEDRHHHAVEFRAERQHIEYGLLAAWDREPGGIQSKEAFQAYLDETIERLNRPVRLTLRVSETWAEQSEALTAAAAREWTTRMVDSIVARRGRSLAHGHYDPESQGMARWRYTTGLLAQAVYDAGQQFGNDDWRAWGAETIGSYVAEDGTIESYSPESYNVDQINSGKMLLRLHAATGDARYRRAADRLWAQLEDHPRTSEGAFWHKLIYPSQVWLDGVYMAGPFYSGYKKAYVEEPDWDDVAKEFRVCYERLRDPRTGLYFHGWDESREQSWADPDSGRSAEFWGRGLGWYAMALVDVLEDLPAAHPAHAEIHGYLVELAEALVKVQDPETGMWSQVLDQPGRTGNYREASGSSMFVYMLAKGVNHGWLDERFAAAAGRGFQGLLRTSVHEHADGSLSLGNICQVAGLGFGRDGSFSYYMIEPIVENDPKGTGPFILAGLEVYELLK